MPIGLFLGGAASGLIGDVLSYSGQQNTNQMNMQIAQMNNQFNAQQAQLNRNFQEQMSDTAVTRREADLRAAGINPLLAVGSQASTPGGATAGSAGLPQLGNPAASLANLGQQTTNAMQTASNINLQDAQAKLATSQTPTPDYAPKIDPKTGELVVPSGGHELGDANLAKIQADTNTSLQTATQIKSNVDLIGAQIKNTDANTGLANIQAALTGQRADILQQTKDAIIKQAAAQGVEAGNVQNLLKSPTWGPIITIIDRLIRPAASALGAAGLTP